MATETTSIYKHSITTHVLFWMCKSYLPLGLNLEIPKGQWYRMEIRVTSKDVNHFDSLLELANTMMDKMVAV